MGTSEKAENVVSDGQIKVLKVSVIGVYYGDKKYMCDR